MSLCKRLRFRHTNTAKGGVDKQPIGDKPIREFAVAAAGQVEHNFCIIDRGVRKGSMTIHVAQREDMFCRGSAIVIYCDKATFIQRNAGSVQPESISSRLATNPQ